MPQDAVPDRLPLGAAPRPATGADLADRLRATLLGDLSPAARAGIDLAVTARIDGADIAELIADATGSHIDLAGAGITAADPPAKPPVPPAEAASREPGRLGRLVVTADPFTVGSLPITFRAEASDMAFDWVEAADGSIGIEIPDAGRDARGSAEVSAPRAALIATIREAVARGLAEARLRLVAFRLELDQARNGGVRVDGFLRIGKGPFTASVRARVVASVGDDLSLRVQKLRLTSANPLIAAILLSQRSRIRAEAAKPRPLAEGLPDGVRITELRLRVRETIALSVRFEGRQAPDSAPE